MNSLIFITGGAKSGKSLFAEKLSLHINASVQNKIAYIATGEIYDDEFLTRIKMHQKRRGKEFVTYEEPIDIDKVIKNSIKAHNVIILECLTTWLGNVQYHFKDNFDSKSENILISIIDEFNKKAETEDSSICFNEGISINSKTPLLPAISEKDKILIIISNEVGLGIVPDNKLSRNYIDQLGRLNQITAHSADHIFFVVSGIPNKIK